MFKRTRRNDEIRELIIETGINKYAEGSCLIRLGKSEVVVTASVENKVPTHLKNTNKGWVTAEYSMLPRSTQSRTVRESRRKNLDGRTQEIQRLIGRSLRAVTKLENLGQRTVWIDCDVLQADGGTRVASIIGGFIVFYEAVLFMLSEKQIKENPIIENLGAISLGIVHSNFLLDLEYQEDLIADVDLNLVATKSNKIIEIQGTAEGDPFTKSDLNELIELGLKGVQKVIEVEEEVINNLKQKYNL
ncbi:MAG: ribonuclease PH [bacterium]|nr:ribonuclease PH [bacterium]